MVFLQFYNDNLTRTISCNAFKRKIKSPCQCRYFLNALSSNEMLIAYTLTATEKKPQLDIGEKHPHSVSNIKKRLRLVT